MDLRTEIERFREWASTQPQDYGEWECDYDEWSDLYAAVEEVLSAPDLSETDIGYLLYALARDNECEIIRDMLEEYVVNSLRLAQAAVSYPDPDARWQVAVFLGTQIEAESCALLRCYTQDSHEYVRRRALLASMRHDPKYAERTARLWLTVPDDYSRLAALTVLHELNSSHLKEARVQLQDDSFVYVREMVDKIRDEA